MNKNSKPDVFLDFVLPKYIVQLNLYTFYIASILAIFINFLIFPSKFAESVLSLVIFEDIFIGIGEVVVIYSGIDTFSKPYFYKVKSKAGKDQKHKDLSLEGFSLKFWYHTLIIMMIILTFIQLIFQHI